MSRVRLTRIEPLIPLPVVFFPSSSSKRLGLQPISMFDTFLHLVMHSDIIGFFCRRFHIPITPLHQLDSITQLPMLFVLPMCLLVSPTQLGEFHVFDGFRRLQAMTSTTIDVTTMITMITITTISNVIPLPDDDADAITFTTANTKTTTPPLPTSNHQCDPTTGCRCQRHQR